MKEFVEKISSYNIFNFLFPGIVYVAILREMTHYDFLIENTLFGLFVYYFIGLVISRIGSLIIEPILKNSSFVKFADYSDYIQATDKDKKVELFSEINNMYRTLIAMLFLLIVVKLYELIDNWLQISIEISFTFLVIVLLVLFIFSYRKQTNYVAKRVNSITKKTNI